ncbi:MAG: hypothetical protein ACPG8N_09160 [Rhodothermales bacterium]
MISPFHAEDESLRFELIGMEIISFIGTGTLPFSTGRMKRFNTVVADSVSTRRIECDSFRPFPTKYRIEFRYLLHEQIMFWPLSCLPRIVFYALLEALSRRTRITSQATL